MHIFEGLLEIPWVGPALWAVLYISDYLLTLACARLYKAQSSIVFEGSFELTPAFQADVDALRKVSPRFLAALIASTAYVFLVRTIVGAWAGYRDLYLGVLGAMLLIEATVHIRHLRNWFIFSRGAGLIQGRITYARGFTLRLSAFELLSFSGLYFGLHLVTASAFVLGGSVACAVLAANHYLLARRHDAAWPAGAASRV